MILARVLFIAQPIKNLQLLNDKQRDFVSFVLRNYVSDGVDVLEIFKLRTVQSEKHGSMDQTANVNIISIVALPRYAEVERGWHERNK